MSEILMCFGDVVLLKELDDDTCEISFKDGVYSRRMLTAIFMIGLSELKDKDITISKILKLVEELDEDNIG